MRTYMFIFFVLLCGAVAARGRIYYVENHGDDGGDGSRVHPWKTLAAVGRVRLGPGDSVFLRGGEVFFGTLRIDNTAAGIRGRPVWIGSYGRSQRRSRRGTHRALCFTGPSGFWCMGFGWRVRAGRRGM